MDSISTLKGLIAMISAFLCFVFPNLTALRVEKTVNLPTYDKSVIGADRIHFLKTGTSDAIILESDGHFAMVDSGEDTDNPRAFEWLNLPGYEQEVLSYLKKAAADENGNVHLDFVLGTHSHSDHIGGFDPVISDPSVTVDRAYLKKYDSGRHWCRGD